MKKQKVDLYKLKQLRNRTNYSYMKCREALIKSNNDFEKAVKYLRQNNSSPYKMDE